MTENITSQSSLFQRDFSKPLAVAFDQPVGTSDGGAVLLRVLDERVGLTAALASALVERRDAGKVELSLVDLFRQRVFGIACGYGDGDDAGRVRPDPVQKLLLNREPLSGSDLASQPTLSRFENAVSSRELYAMSVKLVEHAIARHQQRLGGRARRITIDIDSTKDPAYGQQQGVLFNGHFGSFCYHPLMAFVQFKRESEQYLLSGMLRPGNAHAKLGAIAMLKRLIAHLRAAFPKARLVVRGDGGFAAPEVFAFLEEQDVQYVIAMAGNQAFERIAEEDLQAARAASTLRGQSERHYGHAQYRANSWKYARRVVFKAEVVRYPGKGPRDNPRYLITNMCTHAKVLYRDVYTKRGDMENRLKELKLGVEMDRLSCTRFTANQARLLLHAAAYVLYQELRLAATGTSLGSAQVSTLRERLFKLGGIVKRSTRRIVIHLPQHTPWADDWVRIARTIGAT